MRNLYKETCLELYRNKLKEELPEITEIELNGLTYAFSAGFNMGIAQNENDLLKELALKSLVK